MPPSRASVVDRPDDDGYDEARAVFLGTRRPDGRRSSSSAADEGDVARVVGLRAGAAAWNVDRPVRRRRRARAAGRPKAASCSTCGTMKAIEDRRRREDGVGTRRG